MCVKEFLGYNCGHCSIPVLRQCPLSASNPVFPLCKFPAERPIFTNEYCHPCARVVWNIKVLKEEEEHRVRHLRGECMCEVIFEGEDREERGRSRGSKGTPKGKGKEVVRGELGRQGVVDHGAFEQQMAEREPGGYAGGRRDIEENMGAENNMVVKVQENCVRRDWEPETQAGAYEYVGYYVNNGQNLGTDPEQSYAVACGRYEMPGPLPMGQIGAGMKWYPAQQQFQVSSTTAYQKVIEGAPRGPRATSEPIGKYDCPGGVRQIESHVAQRQPMVVSSDMMRTESAGPGLW